ncbi:hypothetical protein ACLESD_13675 [Pyxidicoccus sp. 3LFB2]
MSPLAWLGRQGIDVVRGAGALGLVAGRTVLAAAEAGAARAHAGAGAVRP